MKFIAIALIQLYQLTLSKLIGNGCKFKPTCSTYTEQAFRKYGLWLGFWLGITRIVRCNPLTKKGHDPVPDLDIKWYQFYQVWLKQPKGERTCMSILITEN